MKLKLHLKKPWPSFYFFIYMMIGIFLHIVFSFIRIIKLPYNLFGLPLIIFGTFLALWVWGFFLKKRTTVNPFRKSNILVIQGPFKISRHPMYLGFVLVLLGLAILLRTIFAFVIPLALFLTLEFLFVRREEKRLIKIFGKKYKDYKKKVRKWL